MAKGKKTGGRIAGTPNKVTVELREAAQTYTTAALQELARLATRAKSETARVAACRELLDRGHGRPAQSSGEEPHTGPIVVTWANGTRL
jgi:hypothetical protein